MNELSESFSTINLNKSLHNKSQNQNQNLNQSRQMNSSNNRSRESRYNTFQNEEHRISLPQRNQKISMKDQKYLRDNIQVVTNFYNFDFKNIRVDEIFLYSITVEDYMGKENPHYGLIKRLAKSLNFKNFLFTFFADFWITGNTLFGDPLNPDEIKLEFAVYYFENQDKIITLDEIEKYPKENIYIITITKKFNIKDFEGKGVNASLTERQHITRFIGSVVNRYLEKNNYKKTDSSQRSLFYKMDPKDFIYTDNEIYFVSGFKVVTGFYDQMQMLCKTVQKFRMLRKQTYLDLWKWCIDNSGKECQRSFYDYCIGKEGFTIYSEKNIKIESIEFNLNPSTCYITQATGIQIPLIQYYWEKYKIQITDPNQPLFLTKRYRKTKDKQTVEEINYFIPELLCIMGKMSFDNLNIAKYTLLKPQEKFDRTNEIMKVIRDYQKRQQKLVEAQKMKKNPSNQNNSILTTKSTEANKNKTSNINKNANDIENKITERNINFELQKVNSFVLKHPSIVVKENKLIPDFKNGDFDLKNQIVI